MFVVKVNELYVSSASLKGEDKEFSEATPKETYSSNCVSLDDDVIALFTKEKANKVAELVDGEVVEMV